MGTRRHTFQGSLAGESLPDGKIVRFLDESAQLAMPALESSSSYSLYAGSDLRRMVRKILLADRNSTSEVSGIDGEESEEAIEFRRGLEYSLDNDVVDLGNENSTDFHVRSWLRKSPVMVQIQFGKVAAASQDNPKRLTGMLSVLSHLDREALHPMSALFVQSCLSFVWPDVKEYAIGVLEHWGDSDLIVSTLKYREVTPQWLDDYRKQVLSEHEGS